MKKNGKLLMGGWANRNICRMRRVKEKGVDADLSLFCDDARRRACITIGICEQAWETVQLESPKEEKEKLLRTHYDALRGTCGDCRRIVVCRRTMSPEQKAFLGHLKRKHALKRA